MGRLWGRKLDVEVRSLDKRWRYDVLLSRLDGTQLALEVYHTHATGGGKIESSALIGVPIAELSWTCGPERSCITCSVIRRVARERKQREEQEAADRMARERKRRREEQEEDQARKRREIAEKIESPKQCKDEKLYYHCVFNGINNTCFWAPLGEGARTYGEVYKCGK